MEDKIIIIFKKKPGEQGIDIEVPLNISAGELIYGLSQGLHLGINMDNPEECYLRAENPVALIRGEASLEELGLRNGTTVYYDR